MDPMAPSFVFVAVVGVALVVVVVVLARARRRPALSTPPPTLTDEAVWLRIYESQLHALATREGKEFALAAVRGAKVAAGVATAALEEFRTRWRSSPATSPATTSPGGRSTTSPATRPAPPLPRPVPMRDGAIERPALPARKGLLELQELLTPKATPDAPDVVSGDASSDAPAKRS